MGLDDLVLAQVPIAFFMRLKDNRTMGPVTAAF